MSSKNMMYMDRRVWDSEYPYPHRTMVVNLKSINRAPHKKVCRPSEWGNPFKIGEDGNRPEVIHKYFVHLVRSEITIAALQDLKGHDLACYCASQDCHGDVLAAFADAYFVFEYALKVDKNSIPTPKELGEQSPVLEWLSSEKRWFFSIGDVTRVGKDLYSVLRSGLIAQISYDLMTVD